MLSEDDLLAIPKQTLAAPQKNGKVGSFLPFAAFAQQKKRADALSVRFLRAALSISRLQRRAASLIGYLGQALFPCLFWVFVTHPGHASLRSLV